MCLLEDPFKPDPVRLLGKQKEIMMYVEDYQDPETVDVDIVRANINHSWNARRDRWTAEPSWPNVTVKALVDRVTELEAENLRLIGAGLSANQRKALRLVGRWAPIQAVDITHDATWADSRGAGINGQTAQALERKGLIEIDRSSSEWVPRLTPAGGAVLDAEKRDG